MLPYEDVWWESHWLFTKYFNSSHHSSINQLHDILYVRRFLSQLLQRPNGFLRHIRTYVPCSVSLVNRPFIFFTFLSLVGSTTLLMTYGINICLYNNPFIVMAEEAFNGTSDAFIASAFLVDMLPILKHVPEWFPRAKFQRKAAMMHNDLEMILNTPFAVTKDLMVFIPWPFLWKFLQLLMTCSGKWQL